MKLEDFLTVPDSAELVGVSRQTIYDWIKLGVLGYIQKGYFRLLDKKAVLAASEIMKTHKHGGRYRGKRKLQGGEK